MDYFIFATVLKCCALLSSLCSVFILVTVRQICIVGVHEWANIVWVEVGFRPFIAHTVVSKECLYMT